MLVTIPPLVIGNRTRAFFKIGARCEGKSAKGQRGWAELGAGASDCDGRKTVVDSVDAKRTWGRALRLGRAVSCVCGSGLMVTGYGVISRSIKDKICDAKGDSHSSSANRRRFSTQPISRFSAFDSAFSVFGSSACNSACSGPSGHDKVKARTALWLAVNTLFVSSSLRARVGPRTSRTSQSPANFG